MHQKRNDQKKENSNRSNPSRRHISGSKRSDAGLKAAPRTLDVFLGGCGLETTPNDISDYCSKYKVTPKNCESIHSRSGHHKCYRITVASEDRDTLLDAQFWPVGIFVGKFYRRKAQAPNHND